LGLVKRWGPQRVEAACARALDAEALSVPLIGRMIERGTEVDRDPASKPAGSNKPARFAREPDHFSTANRLERRSSAEAEAEGGAA